MVADDKRNNGNGGKDVCSKAGGLVGTVTVTIEGTCITDIKFTPASESLSLTNTRV
jgi:hypothetical protein